MLCERCNKNQATMHYTQIINGQVSEYHLCEKCAKEEKISSDFTDFDIFNMFAPKKTQLDTGLICPNCKTTLSEFRKSGIAGCAKCYEIFSPVITPMLSQMQGSTSHIKDKAFEKVMSKDEKIANLKELLKKAISAEEYEKAAKIRDEINELKGEEK